MAHSKFRGSSRAFNSDVEGVWACSAPELPQKNRSINLSKQQFLYILFSVKAGTGQLLSFPGKLNLPDFTRFWHVCKCKRS